MVMSKINQIDTGLNQVCGSLLRCKVPSYGWIAHQLIDLRRVVQRLIWPERQRGGVSQGQCLGYLTAQPRCRTPQGRQQCLHIRSSKPGNKGHRMLEIGTEPHFADGDIRVRQIWIPELPSREHTREHVTNFFRDPKLSLRRALGSRLALRRRSPGFPRRFLLSNLRAQPGTISTSKHSTTSPSCKSWKLANDRPHS